MKTVIYTLISLPLIVGCYHKTLSVSEPNTHIQKSQELQMIMRKFDNLIYEHFQSELDRDERRIEYTQNIIPIVDELVANSKRLQNLQTTHLSNQEREGFFTLAKRLEERSKRLKKMVLSYQTEEISRTLHEIDATCTQCHATIR